MKVLATTLSLLFAGVAFGGQMAPISQETVSEDAPYTTIAAYDVRMDMGDNVFQFDLDEPVEASQLSFWYEQSLRCQGVGVSNVMFIADLDAGEWIASTANPFEGIYHYASPEGMISTKLTLSTDRLLGQRCRIFVRKANFEVPALLDILARVGAECDIDADGVETCAYTLEQIDSDVRSNFKISEADALRFGLQAGAIYRIKGHMIIDADSGAELLSIYSSQYVMD